MDSKRDLLTGVVVGALVGFGTGIMMARASGAETREIIRAKTGEVARDALDWSGEMLGQAVTTAEDVGVRARESARKALVGIRERLDELDSDETLS